MSNLIGLWINRNGKFVRTNEHGSTVMEDPKFFGFSEKELEKFKYNPRDTGEDTGRHQLLLATFKKGWIRLRGSGQAGFSFEYYGDTKQVMEMIVNVLHEDGVMDTVSPNVRYMENDMWWDDEEDDEEEESSIMNFSDKLEFEGTFDASETIGQNSFIRLHDLKDKSNFVGKIKEIKKELEKGNVKNSSELTGDDAIRQSIRDRLVTPDMKFGEKFKRKISDKFQDLFENLKM